MIVKVHTANHHKLITIVDFDLIGKKFEEGKRQLDCSSDFYNGEEKSKGEIILLAKDAYIIHLVGEKSVTFALSREWIDSNNVVRVQNIPHAEAIIMRD